MINKILIIIVLFFAGFSSLVTGLRNDVGYFPIFLGLFFFTLLITSLIQIVSLKTSGKIHDFLVSKKLNGVILGILAILVMGIIISIIKHFL